jgi:hypothetical protein
VPEAAAENVKKDITAVKQGIGKQGIGKEGIHQ